MAKVFIVNLLCPDDEDTTQVVGVATTRALAEARIKELQDENNELFDHDNDDDPPDSESPEYDIEEHDLIEE